MARIADLLRRGPTVSFEFFPPKDDDEAARLRTTIDALKPLSPSFVSVTYRGGRKLAGADHERGARADPAARDRGHAAPDLRRAYPRRLHEIVSGFHAAGVENLLALGGDPLPDEESYRQLSHAIELVELALEQGAQCIGVAAHPSGHPDSHDLVQDRRHLAAKLRLADFAITQFFFRAEEWLRLVDELQALGVDRPVIPGIMPIINLQSIVRMSGSPAIRCRPTSSSGSSRWRTTQGAASGRDRSSPVSCARTCSTRALQACTSSRSTARRRRARSTPRSG